MSAIPFAGLAPDTRAVRGAGEISAFDTRVAIEIGRGLRRLRAGSLSTSEAAAALVDAVNALEHNHRPACALVRAFITRRFADLSGELQTYVLRSAEGHAPDGGSPCAVLMATRGIEPAWNDVDQSVGHRAVLLSAERTPVLADLAGQLATAQPAATAKIYLDPPAMLVSAAPTFATAYGVSSVVAFGAVAWPGESVLLIAFARVALNQTALPGFRILAHQARLLWLQSREAQAALEPHALERARSIMSGELAEAYESELSELLQDWPRRLASVRAETQAAADVTASKIEEQNRHLRRTQRAMLNVVEDLHEARAALESKVAERTRELASANQALEARNRELEEFVYIASHDLQEPLRTIAGYLQMIERRYAAALGPQGDEFIRFAIEGAQRMQALIESLLLYSRVATRAHSFEWLSLDEALDLALQNLALRVEETNAVIERRPLPRVRADRIQMVQLFQNLLSNAIKFAGPRPARIHVDGEMTVAGCTLQIRDEGIGFNPKYADRIFKVFRRLRRDTPGTGIGLAVCKKIVERHGGRIEAQSEPGKGATFSIHLPSPATLEGAP